MQVATRDYSKDLNYSDIEYTQNFLKKMRLKEYGMYSILVNIGEIVIKRKNIANLFSISISTFVCYLKTLKKNGYINYIILDNYDYYIFWIRKSLKQNFKEYFELNQHQLNYLTTQIDQFDTNALEDETNKETESTNIFNTNDLNYKTIEFAKAFLQKMSFKEYGFYCMFVNLGESVIKRREIIEITDYSIGTSIRYLKRLKKSGYLNFQKHNYGYDVFWIRRNSQESIPQPHMYQFVSPSGKWVGASPGNFSKLEKRYKLHKGDLSSLVSGARKQAKGWELAPSDRREDFFKNEKGNVTIGWSSD